MGCGMRRTRRKRSERRRQPNWYISMITMTTLPNDDDGRKRLTPQRYDQANGMHALSEISLSAPNYLVNFRVFRTRFFQSSILLPTDAVRLVTRSTRGGSFTFRFVGMTFPLHDVPLSPCIQRCAATSACRLLVRQTERPPGRRCVQLCRSPGCACRMT